MVPCNVKQAVLCELGLFVLFPWRFEPAGRSIPSTLAILDAVLDTGRPTTVKVAAVCYPVCLLVKYFIKPDSVFELRTVFEDAIPTPVCFRQLFVATLGLVSLGKVSALLHLASEKTESI
jgi:hypothetical protein